VLATGTTSIRLPQHFTHKPTKGSVVQGENPVLFPVPLNIAQLWEFLLFFFNILNLQDKIPTLSKKFGEKLLSDAASHLGRAVTVTRPVR
jgi:hypothetical protein